MPKRRPRVRVKTPAAAVREDPGRHRRHPEARARRFLTYWTSTSGSVCDNDVMALHDILQTLARRRC
jgi:hypothetical protein